MTLERQTLLPLTVTPNPLTAARGEPTADLIGMDAANLFAYSKRNIKRELRDMRRLESAAAALDRLDQETEIYGFTKGQFSIIDLIRAALDITGPADRLTVSAWTTAGASCSAIFDLLQEDRIATARWLMDLTFQRREPELAHAIRQHFGPDSIRVAQNHAKFYMLSAGAWRLVIRTSMNLNYNPRFEDFTIAHNPALYQFLEQITNEVWSRQPRALALDTPYKIHKHFLEDL